jgi:hypothetical protein
LSSPTESTGPDGKSGPVSFYPSAEAQSSLNDKKTALPILRANQFECRSAEKSKKKSSGKNSQKIVPERQIHASLV